MQSYVASATEKVLETSSKPEKLRGLLFPGIHWASEGGGSDLSSVPIPQVESCLVLKNSLVSPDVQCPPVVLDIPGIEEKMVKGKRLGFSGAVLKLSGGNWIKSWKRRWLVVSERGMAFVKRQDLIEQVLAGGEPTSGWLAFDSIVKIEARGDGDVPKKTQAFTLTLTDGKSLSLASDSIKAVEWCRQTATHALVAEVSKKSVSEKRIKDLCEMGADINIETENRGPPIAIVVLIKDLAVAKFLLRRGCNAASLLRWNYLKRDKLTTAASVLYLLIATRNDLNVRGDDVHEWTLLHYLAQEGDFESVKALIARVDGKLSKCEIKDYSSHGYLAPTVSAKNAAGDTSLMLAMKQFPSVTKGDDAEKLSIVLSKGCNPNSKDRYGNPLLHLAISQGHETLARQLVSDGALPQLVDFNGNTAFHLGIKKGMFQLVQWLIVNSNHDQQFINMKDSLCGDSVLSLCVKCNNEKMTLFCLEHQADYSVKPTTWGIKGHDGDSLLHISIKMGMDKLAHAVVELCNVQELFKVDTEGTPVLILAIKQNMFSLVHMIIVNHPAHCAMLCNQSARSDGATAMHVAVRKYLLVLVCFMIERGANLDIQDLRGYTVLHECVSLLCSPAIAPEQSMLVESLMSALVHFKADCRLTENSKKYSPLHLAVLREVPAATTLLLKSEKCNADQRDIRGNSALNLAILATRVDLVALILQHDNVQLNIINSDQLTPLHLAVYQRDQTVIRMLLELDAYPGSWNEAGLCPIHVAAMNNDAASLSTFAQFCKTPGHLELRSERGYTAAMLALEHICVDAFRTLVENHADVNAKLPETRQGLLHLAARLCSESKFCNSGLPELVLSIGIDAGDWIVDDRGVQAKTCIDTIRNSTGITGDIRLIKRNGSTRKEGKTEIIIQPHVRVSIDTVSVHEATGINTSFEQTDASFDTNVSFENLTDVQKDQLLEITKREARQVAETFLNTPMGVRLLESRANIMVNGMKLKLDDALLRAREHIIDTHLAEWIVQLPLIL